MWFSKNGSTPISTIYQPKCRINLSARHRPMGGSLGETLLDVHFYRDCVSYTKTHDLR